MTTFCVLFSIEMAKGWKCCRVRKLRELHIECGLCVRCATCFWEKIPIAEKLQHSTNMNWVTHTWSHIHTHLHRVELHWCFWSSYWGKFAWYTVAQLVFIQVWCDLWSYWGNFWNCNMRNTCWIRDECMRRGKVRNGMGEVMKIKCCTFLNSKPSCWLRSSTDGILALMRLQDEWCTHQFFCFSALRQVNGILVKLFH